jgi:glycosyltransferase involved in cell wall biosynthesis
VIVPLGLDLSSFDVPDNERHVRRTAFRDALGIPIHASVVTLVARIEPVKRVDRFLRVAERLADFDTTHFLIVGDGELREELERLPEARALGARLTWAGLRSDMPDVYFASDILAVTSDNEGTAASAIEAQAAGLPVVSTRVGGMPTVVADGETGVLVAPRDEAAFAAALKRILADAALAREFGKKGSERSHAKFSLDRLLGDTDELYRRLMTAANSRRRSPAHGPESH